VTEAPADLIQLQKAIIVVTGLPADAVGIKGDKKHADKGVSYHLGKDQIKKNKNPYSVRLKRDVNGLTNAASAMDIGDDWPRGGREAWKRFNNLLVAALQGGDPALATIRATNFSPDGSQRKRADRQLAFRIGDSDDNVDIHTHIEWYRDTEGHRDGACITRIVALMEQAITGKEQKGFLMALTDTQQANIAFTLLNIPSPDGSHSRVPLHVWAAMTNKALDAIAEKAGMSPIELNAVKTAAAAGAQAGVAAGTDDLVDAILGKLNSSAGLTKKDVETAVRAALAEASQDEPEA
jgi:hypothetical protein